MVGEDTRKSLKYGKNITNSIPSIGIQVKREVA